jgi:DNA replication and repair protein RecF
MVVREARETRADIVLHPSESTAEDGVGPITKAYRLNGAPKRALDFVGTVTVVTFSPEEVALVSGAPAQRRRHLDVTNSQVSTRYLRALQRYNRVLLQRNRLLRQIRQEGKAGGSLSVWDAELVQSGAFLVLDRARYLGAVAGLVDHWFSELGGWGRLQLQ